jgi:hypothetical protein
VGSEQVLVARIRSTNPADISLWRSTLPGNSRPSERLAIFSESLINQTRPPTSTLISMGAAS